MAKKKPQTFGERLRDARVAKGYSLRKFAKEADVSPTYLSQVEQDKVAVASRRGLSAEITYTPKLRVNPRF
jgi:transcriptional regulator with XRE-family HTH domain